MSSDEGKKDPIKTDDPETETPKFTQADLDRCIKERLDKAERVHKKELSEMESKHKTELERLNMDAESRAKAEAEDERNALIKRAEEAENALRLTRAEKELTNAGLPPELASILLNGSKDDKELVNAVKALSDASQERGNRIYADKVGGRGVPPAPTSTDSDPLRSEMRKAAGLE